MTQTRCCTATLITLVTDHGLRRVAPDAWPIGWLNDDQCSPHAHAVTSKASPRPLSTGIGE
eukprot:10293162-Alexandrium_andersonii.AAC.1